MTIAAELPSRPMHSVTSTAARFLLVTGTAPCEPGVGGVILKDLINQAGRERWHCCWLASKHGSQQPYWDELGTTVLRRQFETGYRPVRGLLGEVISAATLRVLRPGMIASAVKAIQHKCRDWRPQAIIAVLESPAVIETVRRLQESVAIPIRSIVWDDVDLFCRQAVFDRWTRRRIERAFGEVLQKSNRIAVICESMQAEYFRRYGIQSQVLRHGVASEAPSVCLAKESHASEIRIGFAGSNTAPDGLRSLVEGLDLIGWQLNGRDIVLRILGARYLLDSRKPQRIEYFGWRSVEETRSRLAECDLLYLPQSFAADNRTYSELSFPTKLSTYLAAQRPILLHAPDYASLSGFWKEHVLGPEIHTLESSQIVSGLISALRSNIDQFQAWIAAGQKVTEHVIGLKQFAAAVAEFLS